MGDASLAQFGRQAIVLLAQGIAIIDFALPVVGLAVVGLALERSTSLVGSLARLPKAASSPA